MSTLWTPGGERPVPRPGEGGSGDRAGAGGPSPKQGRVGASDTRARPGGGEAPDERAAELRRQLADVPAESVVSNHCYGLFELAALHLSTEPPQFDKARVAIDALGCLVQGMEGRLGPEESSLNEGLAQLRLAFVQISKGAGAGDGTS